jgi:hypothetical protein
MIVTIRARAKEQQMKRRFTLVFLIAAALTIVWPAASIATAPNNEANTYAFFLEVPNSARDSAGDTLSVTGEGTFGVHPKSATGGGNYTFTAADGTTFSGTWTVNGLIAFQPYGCGVLFGNPIPPNLCGGRVDLDVTATTPFGPQSAQLTIYCEIGSPPSSSEEGITAVVPSVGSFNRQTGGMNVYVKS